MGFLSVGGGFRSVRSIIPVRLISSVRGIGVAVSVRTSTLLFKDFIFSLWDTPNRCSSSIISKPRSLYSMSSDRSRCVPITRSTSPSLTLEMISLASFESTLSSHSGRLCTVISSSLQPRAIDFDGVLTIIWSMNFDFFKVERIRNKSLCS